MGASVGRDRAACTKHGAASGEGFVESFERNAASDTDGGWILGVQWHPEETAATDASQQVLFDTLVRLAGDRAVKA